MTPGRASLESILSRCGSALGAEQLDRLWAYHRMLREANAELNLTRIHNFENMVLKHYVDSLLVLRFVELPSPLVDMGSGPGLPGIPLKIARPETRMILAESRSARAEFLREVCARLEMKDVEVHAHKLGPNYSGQVPGIISRALGEIPETLGRVSSCLLPGGRMIFMKGPHCDAELSVAGGAQSRLFRVAADNAYTIPGTSHQRRLVVYERLATPASTRSRRLLVAPDFHGPVREVSSESNPSFRLFRALLSARGIRKHGQALFAGPRIVAEVLAR